MIMMLARSCSDGDAQVAAVLMEMIMWLQY
jgi:hypothetical protein